MYEWGVGDRENVPLIELNSVIQTDNPDLIRPPDGSWSTLPYGYALFKFADSSASSQNWDLTEVAAVRIQGDNLDVVDIALEIEDQDVGFRWDTYKDFDPSQGDFIVDPPLDTFQVRVVFRGTPPSPATMFTGITIDIYACWSSK